MAARIRSYLAAVTHRGRCMALAAGRQARKWECVVECACVWEVATEYGGARRRLAIGALREWECIAVRAPFGKLRVSCV